MHSRVDEIDKYIVESGTVVFPLMAQWVKNLPVPVIGDVRLISGSGRSPGGGHGNPLQDSCLGNPMDRGTCGLQSMESQRVGRN